MALGGGIPSWQKFYGQVPGVAPQAVLDLMPKATGPAAVLANPVATPAPANAVTRTNAVETNLANTAGIQQLADLINQINLKAQQAANMGRIPNEAALEAASSGNIASALRGEVPADVLYQIGRQAAERGVATGSPGGANTNADYLRALGLTSLGLQNTGQTWMNQAVGRNPAAPLFDPSTMTLTPAQAGQLDLGWQGLQNQLTLGQLQIQARLQEAAMEAAARARGYGGGAAAGTKQGPTTAQPNYADLFTEPKPTGSPLTDLPLRPFPGDTTVPTWADIPSSIFGGTQPALNYDAGQYPLKSWDFGQVPSLQYDLPTPGSNPMLDLFNTGTASDELFPEYWLQSGG